MALLHVSDTGSVLLAAAGFAPGIDWLDPLTAGPVTTGSPEERAPVLQPGADRPVEPLLRERDAAVAAAGEFVLWFHDCLSGRLQVLQAVDRIPAGAPIRLRMEPEPVHLLQPRAVPGAIGAAQPIAPAARERMRKKWRAVRSPDPREVFDPAYRRQFPWTTDGLTEAERTLLRRLDAGAHGWAEALGWGPTDDGGPRLDEMLAQAAFERLAPLLTPTARVNRHGKAVLAGTASFEPRAPFPFGGAVATDWRYEPATGALRPACGP